MQRSYHFPLAERTRLSPVERDQLLAAARARPFADGQFVQQQGTPGDQSGDHTGATRPDGLRDH